MEWHQAERTQTKKRRYNFEIDGIYLLLWKSNSCLFVWASVDSLNSYVAEVILIYYHIIFTSSQIVAIKGIISKLHFNSGSCVGTSYSSGISLQVKKNNIFVVCILCGRIQKTWILSNSYVLKSWFLERKLMIYLMCETWDLIPSSQ